MCLLILSIFVSLSLAADPQPCCIMETYSAVLISVSGTMAVGSTHGRLADDVMEMHYDYTRPMVVSISHQRDPNTGIRGNLTVIYDFANMKQHILPEPGRCYTQHLDSNSLPPPCMTKNLTYSGSYMIGSDLTRVKVNSFTGQFGPFQATISLTDKHCTPFAYSQYGRYGQTESLQSFLFTNIKKGITNPSLFSIPPECRLFTNIIGRRNLDAQTLNFQKTPFYIFSHQCMMYDF